MAIPIVNPNPPRDGQAILSYAGLDLQIVRTEEWVCEPERDWSGVDYVLNHVIIGVKAVVNPFATATTPGTRAGVTMANLQEILTVPRQLLTYRIGRDLVVSSPRVGAVCDAKNGPFPLACRILEVSGVKSAVIYFRIETWTGGDASALNNQTFVLSNRWNVAAHVDEDWKTTLTTHGRMRVRTDALQTLNPPSPDIFRKAVLPLPVMDGFKRDQVDVIAKEDGTELDWTCVDVQKSLNLPLGAQLGLTRIEGSYTTGSEVNYKDMKDVAKLVMAAAQTDLTNPLNLIPILFNLVPSVKNSFHIRVYGPPSTGQFQAQGGQRAQLLGIGVLTALDRFAPQVGNGGFGQFGDPFTGGLVSLYATYDVAEMLVEIRGEILGTVGAAFNPTAFQNRVNAGDDINGPALFPILGFKGQAAANPNPPNDGTSKGVFVGTLLEQTLRGALIPPVSNSPSVLSADVGQNFG